MHEILNKMGDSPYQQVHVHGMYTVYLPKIIHHTQVPKTIRKKGSD